VNVERLNAIARATQSDMTRTDVVANLQRLRDALGQQVNNPADSSAQQAVADSLTRLRDTLSASETNSFPPSWRQVLEELQVEDVVGREILAQVDATFERNQITPSVALEAITEMANRVENIAGTLQQLIGAFEFLGIGAEELEPGEAEVMVVIPRSEVASELRQLGQEYVNLERLLGPFLELGTGSRPPVAIKAISSSDFAVYLAVAPFAAKYLADAIQSVLNVYKTILDIREQRQRLAESGVPAQALATVDDHANNRMATEIENIAGRVVAEATGIGDGRANELRQEVRLALGAFANRIDHGYNIDIRAEPPEQSESDDDDAQPDPATTALLDAVERINAAADDLKFITSTGRPILSLPEASFEDDGQEAKGAAPSP
jgi:hypothetical protein